MTSQLNITKKSSLYQVETNERRANDEAARKRMKLIENPSSNEAETTQLREKKKFFLYFYVIIEAAVMRNFP